MKEKMERGDAIDVGDLVTGRTPEGHYILRAFIKGTDYCAADEEKWIWSIGKNRKTGQIVASISTNFYQHPDFECLWLR
jgi:hypothetical protein